MLPFREGADLCMMWSLQIFCIICIIFIAQMVWGDVNEYESAVLFGR